jgi:hemolysin III
VDNFVHIVGLLLGTVGAAALMSRAVVERSAIVPLSIYAFGLVVMLGCSAAYHLAVDPARRAWLRRLDHAAIFVMIAGTYTPFLARVADNTVGYTFMALVWTVAVMGVIAKLSLSLKNEALSIVIYLALGWALVAAFEPLTATLDPTTVGLLLAGGILYSVGVGAYLWGGLPFQRAIWHLFVLAAAACHYVAVFSIAGSA